MDPSRYTALFAAESREHLQRCTRELLAWERNLSATAPVQGLFRSLHTIKGMAAALGHTRLSGLVHALETLCAEVRDGRVPATPELVDLGLRAVDRIEAGVALALDGRDADLPVEDLLREVEHTVPPAGSSAPPGPVPEAGEGPPPVEVGGVRVRVRLVPGATMPGARAALVLRRAEGLGHVSAVAPPPAVRTGERFDGRFAFSLAGGPAPAEVRALLSGVGEVAEVEVEVEAGAHRDADEERQVRVALRRLNALVALTGELVLARNRLTALADRRRDPDLELVAHGLARLTGQLQEQVLRARMAPVREVFDRFPRAVRDLARQLDKAVRLETAGEEIELDRAILDELADPLLHLLRNAVDHGIEPPAEREAAGKPAEGRVTVTARRDRNAVVITVRDDGRGVETDRVLAEAREAGWLDTPSEDPAEQVFRILARPGFSTARRVTDVSGRGVGIDAVVHWVRRMGGTIGLTTRSGEGTTVAVRLPLTVAILPALLVGVGDRRFAVPLGFVAETTRVAGQALHRGKPVPVLDWLPLEAVGAEGVPWKPGVILEVAGRQGALVVDRLLGQEDIVVGPLAAPAGTPPWVNGATILADGGAALILDPAVLVEGVRA